MTNTVVLYYDDGYDSEANAAISCGAEYDTERQTLLSCVVLNTTERHTPMEACEEMMRGMPRCSSTNSDITEIKERKKISRWAFVRISVSVRWAHVRPVGFCPHTRSDIFKGNY